MKVRCLANSGATLTESYYAMGFTPRTEFHLTIGHEYIVYALCIWKGNLFYLLESDHGNGPDWYPPMIFEITQASLPASWGFGYRESSGEAVWGFEELVASEQYLHALAEHEWSAIEKYRLRKRQIERECAGTTAEGTEVESE